MQKTLISIIIPFFNAEKYIDRIIENILPQLNDQIEVILVDNGSTDKSNAIANQYVINNKNIILVIETKKGVHNARNTGIKKANGDYLWFVDVDDQIVNDALVTLSKKIEKNDNVDMFVFGLDEIISNEKIHSTRVPSDESRYEMINGEDKVISLFERNLLTLTFNKIISKKYIEECNVQFKNIHTGEDYQFYLELLLNNPEIMQIPVIVYKYYIDNSNSLTKKFDEQRFEVLSSQLILIKKILNMTITSEHEKAKLLNLINSRNRNYLISNLFDRGRTIGVSDCAKCLKKYNDTFPISIKQTAQTRYISKLMKLKIFVSYCPNFFTVTVLKAMFFVKSRKAF